MKDKWQTTWLQSFYYESFQPDQSQYPYILHTTVNSENCIFYADIELHAHIYYDIQTTVYKL